MFTVKMLNLYCYELMWKNEEQEGNRYLMVDDYKLDKVLDKSKEAIGTIILRLWLKKMINC